jgi:DNA-binding response OmpR family regulator
MAWPLLRGCSKPAAGAHEPLTPAMQREPRWAVGLAGVSMTAPLDHVRILLVEDDPIIGLDLRDMLEAAGAVVLGPAYDSASALTLLGEGPVDLAVLDNIIVGGDSTPVADALIQQGVPFLFHTSQRGTLDERYPQVPIIDKPSRPGELVAALHSLVPRS